MTQILDVEGAPLAPESIHMLEYVALRASELSSAAIRDRIRAAAQELENVVAPVSAADARLRPVDGKTAPDLGLRLVVPGFDDSHPVGGPDRHRRGLIAEVVEPCR